MLTCIIEFSYYFHIQRLIRNFVLLYGTVTQQMLKSYIYKLFKFWKANARYQTKHTIIFFKSSNTTLYKNGVSVRKIEPKEKGILTFRFHEDNMETIFIFITMILYITLSNNLHIKRGKKIVIPFSILTNWIRILSLSS